MQLRTLLSGTPVTRAIARLNEVALSDLPKRLSAVTFGTAIQLWVIFAVREVGADYFRPYLPIGALLFVLGHGVVLIALFSADIRHELETLPIVATVFLYTWGFFALRDSGAAVFYAAVFASSAAIVFICVVVIRAWHRGSRTETEE